MTDAVIVRYALTGGALGSPEERAAVYALQERLREVLAGPDAGEFAGNEFGDAEAALFLDGPDAERLYTAVEDVLRALPNRPARVTLRYGDPDDPTSVRREFDLDTGPTGPPPPRAPAPRRRRIRPAEGDVFAIPIDAARSVYGQVVATSDDHILVAVFDTEQLEDADRADILLIAFTFDDCLVDGEWRIAGHRPVRPDVPWPVYKMNNGSMGTFVQDHFGRRFREATPEEARTLKSRVQSSPQDVTDAARAAFGVGEWLDRYDRYIPDESTTVARVIGP
ncbi:Imm26 family immunity protein [Dactylosporangium sp. NPDC005572]|uniref:Imm26 family immunity protein n=1 Tax=Dactylosporangium sp. NPDC005572 TaxID=3156889 RepID=UPI0033A1895D